MSHLAMYNICTYLHSKYWHLISKLVDILVKVSVQQDISELEETMIKVHNMNKQVQEFGIPYVIRRMPYIRAPNNLILQL